MNRRPWERQLCSDVVNLRGRQRGDLAAAKIETAIRQATAASPPLNAEQVNRLASLLMSGGQS